MLYSARLIFIASIGARPASEANDYTLDRSTACGDHRAPLVGDLELLISYSAYQMDDSNRTERSRALVCDKRGMVIGILFKTNLVLSRVDVTGAKARQDWFSLRSRVSALGRVFGILLILIFTQNTTQRSASF